MRQEELSIERTRVACSTSSASVGSEFHTVGNDGQMISVSGCSVSNSTIDEGAALS